MPAASAPRRSLRRRANGLRASHEKLPLRAVLVSNVSNSGGGGVVGFRDMLRAIRAKRPDMDLVAIFPHKGDVAPMCAQYGVTTRTAWTPWWAFGKWSKTPGFDLHAVVGAIPYTTFLIPGIAQAVILLRRLRPTVVISNTMTIPSHAIAAKLVGIPHYWVVREFGREDHRLWFLLGYRRTVRLIGRMSEAVICNSHAVERALLDHDPTMKTHVLYPVVDTPLGTPTERRPGERLRALLVGYYSLSKGQDLAIEAVSIARQAGVEIELILVGAGSHKPLANLARRLDVDDLVSIHEPTSNLEAYWSSAHVGLMCSQSEAFGRVTVEAMRAGLPVCGTDSGGTPEIIEAGITGLLSRAGDAHALAANLMTLESDEALRRKLASAAVAASQRYQRERHDTAFAAMLGL